MHTAESYPTTNIDPLVLERHCGFKNCVCRHESRCFKGWIDREDGTATSPCPICRQSLALVLSEVAPLGHRTDKDHSQIRSHAKSDH
jgi:hypothetical protein